MLPNGRPVSLHERLQLRRREILDELRLRVLVTVGNEHRERTHDLRSHDEGAPHVVALRMGLLAEDDHLVPEHAPGAGEGARIDVRSGSVEEVAVPEENLHVWRILTDGS